MARSSLDGVKAANCLQRRKRSRRKAIQCPVATRAVGSLPELINQRGRSVIQIIERMQPTMIINPNHQYFSIFSSRHVPRGLGSVLIECGYKAKNPGVLAATTGLPSPRLLIQESHETFPCPKTPSAAIIWFDRNPKKIAAERRAQRVS